MRDDAAVQRALGLAPRQLWIGGQWQDAGGGKTFAVEDPATGQSIADVADASPDDARAAAAASTAAQAAWAVTAPRERSEILRATYEAMMAQQEDLAVLMTLEMGKPISESRTEVAYSAEFFRWFSEEAVRIDGRYAVTPNGAGRLLVMKQPVGPTLLITPWNFPLAMGARKIGPAIAAGCTMTVKPAGQTPLSMLALARILDDVGLPKGVLNVVTTTASGATMEPLITGGLVRKLSFTGSTEVGRRLMAQASEQVLRTSMELGGNAPFLVFADADLDAAVDGAVLAKMRNNGEACTAANRFHVHEDVAAEFGRMLAERLGSMKVGHGLDEASQVGPLIDDKQQGKVDELVVDAVDKGAKVATGGSVGAGAGYFYQPTVLVDVPANARLLKEEIFGPVAPITTFSTDDEAVAAANDTEFGLVGYVYTTDLKRAFRIVERLQTGMVGLNQGMVSNPAAPFGGVKQSGLGREGGVEGISEYLDTKYVAIAL